jgi:acetyl esterase/lipase
MEPKEGVRMLELKFNRKTIRGSLARQLLKLVRRIPSTEDRTKVNFGWLYTTQLSADFQFPKSMEVSSIQLQHARLEWIQKKNEPADFLVIQLHGGAYMSGYSDTYRRSAIQYLKITQRTSVMSVDYRLAPEHPYPAALEDAFDAYQMALKLGYSASRIIVVGDSAGGGLALALGLYLRDRQLVLPKAIITMSAWTDLAGEGESYLRNNMMDPLLGDKSAPLDVLAYAKPEELHDPYVSPAYGKYHDFTHLMMHVGSYEILESDTLTVAKKAAMAGNPVDVTIYRGMFHVFQLAFSLIPEAKKAWREIGHYIARQFGYNDR